MAAPTLGNIRLNHVAMSVPPSLLDAAGRADLVGVDPARYLREAALADARGEVLLPSDLIAAG